VLFLLSDESGYITGARSQSTEARRCSRLDYARQMTPVRPSRQFDGGYKGSPAGQSRAAQAGMEPGDEAVDVEDRPLEPLPKLRG